LFDVADDRRLFMDALAYIVQNPGKRVNFAFVLQGTEGDGKTFFFKLLASVLGLENVTTVGPQHVQDKFTGWAEGSQLVFCEEIKLHGHNRFDVLNQLKPYVTNTMIPIRRMNVDTYMVVNTASYILVTNHKDALPLTDGDSRYAILFSRFQTRAQLLDFMSENPTYYDDLYGSLDESPGAIRKWLLEWEISPSFRPDARAPSTAAKAEMIMYSQSEEARTLEEVLAESKRLDVTGMLLNATVLVDEFDARDVSLPYGKGLNKLLLDAGFTQLGRVRIDGKLCNYWTQQPAHFRLHDGRPNARAIRQWLNEDEL
jgi:hypothetical protein